MQSSTSYLSGAKPSISPLAGGCCGTRKRKGLGAQLTPAATASKDGQEFKYLQLQLPTPPQTRVTKSVFSKSSNTVKECPPSKLAEFAVIGRSNVGKSSLINSLTGSDKLAKVSKTPGGFSFLGPTSEFLQAFP
jgi:ribosome biogenesis GTPase A